MSPENPKVRYLKISQAHAVERYPVSLPAGFSTKGGTSDLRDLRPNSDEAGSVCYVAVESGSGFQE